MNKDTFFNETKTLFGPFDATGPLTRQSMESIVRELYEYLYWRNLGNEPPGDLLRQNPKIALLVLDFSAFIDSLDKKSRTTLLDFMSGPGMMLHLIYSIDDMMTKSAGSSSDESDDESDDEFVVVSHSDAQVPPTPDAPGIVVAWLPFLTQASD